MNPARLVLLALLPAVLTACPNRDKDKTVEDTDRKGTLNTPAVKLVVGGMDPSVTDPDTELHAEIFGSAFERESAVTLSGTPARDVKYQDESSLAVTVPGLQPGTYDVTVTNPDGTKATLRKGLTVRDAVRASCQGVAIYFDFDSSTLAAPAREQVEALATCVRASGQSVTVEGHCDERGTTEYNLSLGQRRADAVGRYLTGAGMNPSRVRSVSWGEERPAVEGHDADAWAANRRAVIVVEE
jgi:peptidoglycan-associated lipoprotein